MDDSTFVCTFCSVSYTAHDPRQRYCTYKCAAGARAVRVKNRNRERQAAKRCTDCGCSISERSANARLCVECRDRHVAVNVARTRSKRPLNTSCIHCGEPFDQPRPTRFCSMVCSGRYGRAKQVGQFQGICVACGAEFTAVDNRPNTCSRTCAEWARLRPGVPRVLARECEYCAAPFTAYKGGQRFCGPSCAKRPSAARRRAAQRGVHVEYVCRARLATRDKWTCKLCGNKVNRGRKFPHLMALGGEHSYANTQLAHLICNIRKGGRMTTATQLALIG